MIIKSRSWILFAAAGLLVLLPTQVSAQPETGPTIDSEGEGTVEVAPDYAEFWFTMKTNGETFEAAAKSAEGFKKALATALEEQELAPFSTVYSGVSIPTVQKKQAVVSARLRFSLSRMNSEDGKAGGFGALCDELQTLGGKIGATLEGPFLGYGEEQQIEQQAISRATENALYKADAVAGLMQSQIYAVQSVTIKDVTWNSSNSERIETIPDVQRIVCRAEVVVSYLYNPY